MTHFKALLGASFFLMASLSALSEVGFDDDEGLSNHGGEISSKNPFFFRAAYDYIFKSDFDDHDADGKIGYSTGTAELSSFIYYNPNRKEGMTLGVNYTAIDLDWNDNPYFGQTHFNNAGIRFMAFSGRLCDWMWKGFVNYTLDTTHPDFTYYSLWDFAIWGTYNWRKCVQLSIGFYAQTGMKADRVWPIIGFDWQYSDRIHIAAVFPNDMHIDYQINKCWSVGACLNVYRNRARAGSEHSSSSSSSSSDSFPSSSSNFFSSSSSSSLQEPLNKAIWVYENSGLEFCLNYSANELTYVNVHVGYTFGGKLKITDQHYEKRKHFDFDAAPYYGGEFGYKF